MFDVRSHHRSGRLRPQCQRGSVAVVEGVHFLADDVRLFAYAAGEQRRLFENRRPDFVVVVGAKHLARGCFTWFQTALAGGKMSRVPLTALIKLLFPIHPSGFDVVHGVLPEALPLIVC